MKILLVEDHALVRAGVKRLLSTMLEVEILEAANGRDALGVVRAAQMDLIILDINLPGLGGLELLRRLMDLGAGPVLVLSMHAEPIYIRRALEAGAAGYATKNISPDELLTAVKKVLSGGRYVEADLAQSLVLHGALVPQEFDNLGARELEIMRLLAKGCSLGEIAEAIGVGYKTIANSCSDMKTKLGVSRTADLLRLAIAAGLE
jgi:two-component system invasion response regulator UvrY